MDLHIYNLKYFVRINQVTMNNIQCPNSINFTNLKILNAVYIELEAITYPR